MFQRDPRAGAFLGGDRVSGQDIRDQNGAFCTPFHDDDSSRLASDIYLSLICWNTVIAAQSIANIVKSSLGPLGLDKMLVDNIGVRIDIFMRFIRPAMK
jgi:T-complex protein 1 subunit alpha